MDRLNFSLPEFTRIIWASEKAREIWQPRIACITSVWPKIELGTIREGIRRGALQSVSPADLVYLQNWCYENNLRFCILQQEGAAKVYGNASIAYTDGSPWTYRVYVGDDPKGFMKAWTAMDNLEIGAYLGYPSCCSEFFQTNWQENGWRDLTPLMRAGDGSYTCNILLRHLGVRAVFHLPCAFDCDVTTVVGTRILGYARSTGYDKEVDWLTDMLNWPVRWSSLHGVAMITTPVVKVITSTEPLPEEVRIDRPGTTYPEGGATGVDFPFQLPGRIIMIQGLQNTWADNGFSSLSGMQKAHDLILESVEKILLDTGKILDLGCGNGLLLECVTKRFTQLTPVGVESDSKRYWKAKERVSDVHNCHIRSIDVYLGISYELTFISLNRLYEMATDVDMFLLHLRAHTKYLLLYCYEDWKPELDTLIARHFTVVNIDQNETSEARILKSKS